MSSQRENSTADQPQHGSAAAPLFWACLLIAAALYAPCVLADRIVGWSDLRQEYERNQTELVTAQQHVRHLQRVAAALEADAEFSAQVARAELGAAPAGTQSIALPPELNHDPRIPPATAVAEPPREPWYVPSLRLIAGDATLRRNLLIAAAAVFLFGFLVFHDGAFAAPRGVLRTVFGRYVRDEGGEK